MHADDQQSLNQFLASVERRALVIAELSTRNRDEALDLVQDAMLAFVRRYAKKPRGEWAPLFYRVLQNKLRDWARRSSVRNRWRVWFRHDSAEEGDPIQSMPDPRARLPEHIIDNQAALETLASAIGALPARQRQAVLLRVWEGLDVTETALAMGCSAGSVKTHLSRGLGRLRQIAEKADD